MAFDIQDAEGTKLHHIQSGASHTHVWAIDWFDDATIVLYSSDIGTYAWTLAEDGSINEVSQPVSAELKEFGEQIRKTE